MYCSLPKFLTAQVLSMRTTPPEDFHQHSESDSPTAVSTARCSRLSSTRFMIFAFLIILLAGAIGEKVLETPFWSFNGTWLLPSFFLSHGIKVFSGPHTGSYQSTLYGPVTVLTYLPTALMRTPNAVVLSASILTVLLGFGAALWMHMAASRGQWRLSILPFLATGFMILYLEPLRYSCIRIHADAPAIFFGALAMIALCRGKRLNTLGLLASAACAVLSVWAKQPFIGVPIGLCIFIAITQGRRQLLRYFLFLVLAGAAISAVFAVTFGVHELYFNLLWVPAHQPWKNSSKIGALFQNFRWLITIAFPVFVGLAACIIYLYRKSKLSLASLRSFTSRKIWFASLVVGVCSLPLSVMGASKMGGDVNSFSLCLFFLLLALMLLLQEAMISAADSQLCNIAHASILALMGVAMSFTVLFIALIPTHLRSLPDTEQEVAFRYVLAHPGQVYFPWFPLVHLMAEHADYNSGYGLWDHVAAGVVPSEQEFRTHMPSSAESVAFGRDGNTHVSDMNLMTYLPGYICASRNPELPGFIILSKTPATGGCKLITPEDMDRFSKEGSKGTPTP